MGGILKKFGPHYAIERFGVLFLTIVFAMSAVIGSILSRKIAYDHRALSGNAVYTRSFSMSQSGTSGSVRGVYSNTDHTKVMVLLSFNDMSKIPADASKYSIIMSGATQSGAYEPCKSTPSAMLYSLGSTGYMCLYLQDVNGFPSQLIQMYLQTDVNLTGQSSSSGYDRCLIYFNPGGSYATHADFLEKSDWTMFDMIEELMTRSEEKAIRLALQDDLEQMAQQQILIAEYTDRLEEYGVIVPQIPVQIQDTVYGVVKDGSYDGRLHYITSYGGGWVDDSGSQGFRSDEVTLYLDSKSTLSGGFDFNWQDGRILTGYLEQLSGATSISEWNNWLNGRRQTASTETDFGTVVGNMTWQMADGTAVPTEKTAITQREQDIAKAIKDLRNAWQSYYSLKQQYQCTNLPKLLQLELDGRNSVDVYTVNTGENGSLLTIV